jgi:hypothetical protein
MKTRTVEEHYTVEVNYYGCEKCDFESESEDATFRHQAREHVVKELKKVDGRDWLRFEDPSDFDIYLKWDGGYELSDPHFGEWSGPGWYVEVYESGPCRRKCCINYWYKLVPEAEFLKPKDPPL